MEEVHHKMFAMDLLKDYKYTWISLFKKMVLTPLKVKSIRDTTAYDIRLLACKLCSRWCFKTGCETKKLISNYKNVQ